MGFTGLDRQSVSDAHHGQGTDAAPNPLQEQATAIRFSEPSGQQRGGERPVRLAQAAEIDNPFIPQTPAPAADRFPSETLYKNAYGQYSQAKADAAKRGSDSPEAEAMGTVEPRFNEALTQSQREWGQAMLTVALKMGLKSTTPIQDAVTRFDTASEAVGKFGSPMNPTELAKALGDLRNYFSLDKNSPEARQIAQRLPAGMVDAATNLRNAGNDPIYREYNKTVGPTVINRLMMLSHYRDVLGAAGMTSKQQSIQHQYDDLMKNS
jgi:hypothetical protein